MSRMRLLASIGLLAALLTSTAAAVEVALTVAETAGVARASEPVTTGVPFAKGALKSIAALSLRDEAGMALPAQFRVLSKWPDGSARVVLVDVQVTVPAGGVVKLTLSDGGGAAVINRRIMLQGGGGQVQIQGRVQVGVGVQGGNGQMQVKVIVDGQEIDVSGQPAGGTMPFEEGPDAITLTPGPLEISVSKEKFNLFRSVKLNGKELLGGPARIVLTTADGKQVTCGDVPPSEVKIEEIGPLRAVILACGRLADQHNKLLGYTCRITAYAGKPYVKVSFWLEDDGRYGWVGKPEWFNFDGLSIELPVKATRVGCEGANWVAANFMLTQDNESGKGDPKAFHYRASGNLAEVHSHPDKEGERASGQISLNSATASVNVAVKDFWQNYPKGLRVKDGTLWIDLWPTWGQWPRACPGSKCNEMQEYRKPDLYAFPGGMHKRHEMIFEFAAPGKPADMKSTAATLDQPLMLLASSQYYADTEALAPFAPGDFRPPDAPAARQVDRWNTWARNVADPTNPRGVEGCRATCNFGPFYGIMDFGDFFWAEGVTSLHYDWPWIMLLDYVRLQDRKFFDYAAEMVKHRIDVDQVWSDREEYYFRGLCRFEMGFVDIHGGNNDGHYKPIATHNWDRGPLWWYWLTGDPSAYECVVRNCEVGIKLRQVDNHADDAEGRKLGDQTRGSGWAIGCLCDAYDMTADPKYLDWARTLWKMHLRALWKSKGPNYGMTGPNVLQFYYPTNALVLLHQRTGDPELLEYMRDLCRYCDDPAHWKNYPDDMAIHMTNFYGYLAWVDKDAKMLVRARELFAKGLPAGDARLVLWTGNGAYTKEAGKPLRNGHIYLWAERKLAGAAKD